MLAHVPSFGRNPRGSPDFQAYPVPKACMHVLGTGVPRRLGVARSASSPQAAQALGCSLTPGLWISLGWVTCMAQAASVPGLWTLGFLLLRGACLWVWVVVGFGFWLRPATPGWDVGVCVCFAPVPLVPRDSWLGCAAWVCVLGPGFSCAPPLLAGVSGFVCACVRAPLAPRHSCLGCAAWVRVFGLGFWLRPATPGWAGGLCVCWCACSPCTTPLLAGVCSVRVCVWAGVSAAPRHSWLGCWDVRVCVRAPLVPRHSWLGCAAWVSVLGFGFQLRPAPLGWGIGVSVCSCARSACTPPLLAGVCGVGVGVWARGFGCAPPLLAGVCGMCVCVLARVFGCAPPVLAGLVGCVCADVRAPLVPRHSWLGCAVWVWVFGLGFRLRPATPGWGVRVCVRAPPVPHHSWLGCAACVCVLGLGFRLRPATPGWGVGLCVCLCARSACTPPLLAGVCGVGVCAWTRVWAAPHHSWLGCWGVCVLVFALRLYPATPGLGVRRGCVCSGSGFGCAPPLLAAVFGCVCAGVRTPPVPRLSWLGCAVWVCVLWLGFWLRPATPRGDGGVCVCWCACSPCTPPLLAGVCGVSVCFWAGVLAAPRHSLMWCWGVRVCVHAPPVPHTSWLGCAAWVFVLGFGFPLRSATPGWGVGVCVCSCAPPTCTSPLLAGVCGVGVGVCARVSAALRHSWLGCAAWVCGFGLRFPLRPATSGLGGGVCVYAGVRAPLVPRHSWLGCGVWVWVFGLRFQLRPATPGWGVRVCVRAPPVPRTSWQGCAAWVCVLGFRFSVRPATPAWGVGVCVCSCARSACTPPLLAGVCGVGVGVWARVSAAPRHSWLGCAACPCVFGLGFWLRPATPGWGGGVCVCWCACPPYTRHDWLGCAVWVWVFGLGFRPRPATPCCGVRVCVRAPPVPRHTWLGCAASVCVLALGFRLRPASPGWGVGVCVCWCARSASTLPLLAGVCGVGVCLGWGFGCAPPLLAGVLGTVCLCASSPCTPPLPAGAHGVGVCVWVRVSAASRHSWLGGRGVCVLVWALPLYLATPGWSVRCGSVCLGWGFSCAPPLLAGVLGCACWCA